MFSNPLPPERLERLQEEAKELLVTFSILYAKNYGATVFEKIKEELAASNDGDDLRLTYRPPSAKPAKTSRFTGECYVRQGEGPGTFGGWKKTFVVERDDNGIDLFPDEKAYKAGKKATTTIRTAGYSVVTDVSWHYSTSMKSLAAGLGLTEAEVVALTTFSRYSWALAHPNRTNYIFQLHQGKNSSCLCFGGGNASVDPDEAGAENRNEIIRYVNAMQTCVSRANKACDAATETSRIAFRKACQQIPSKIDTLRGWSDNGTEAEILVDLLLEALVPNLRDQIFEELKGPTSVKLMLWYKTQGIIQKAMVAAVDPAWERMQKEAANLESKVEAAVRPAITKILQIKEEVEGKIQTQVGDRLGSQLAKYVTPFIQPIIAVFESPLKRGFASGRDILATRIDVQTLQQSKSERNAYLDGLAQSWAFVSTIREAAREVVEPLKALSKLSSEVFEDLDPEELRNNAEDIVLETVDAGAYTVAVRLDAGEPNNVQLLEKLLADYDHDAVVKRCEFTKEVTRRLLIGPFKKLTSPITDPIVDAINDAIPEEMADFLNVEGIIDKLIDVLVGTPVDKVVAAAYSQE